MFRAKMHKLSIITASHQNPDGLASLKTQIQSVLGDGIDWIVKDSGACERSALWGESISDPNIHFLGGRDNGIYSALNCALSKCRSEFYLVAGTDDSLDSRSLFKIKEMFWAKEFNNVDVASFPVFVNGRISHKKWLRPTCVSVSGLVSSHSVGTIIRRSLHDSIGGYDERYKILADALFIRRAHQAGAKFKYYKNPVMGSFSLSGISSTQHARRILEAYSYNVACDDSPSLQAILMMLRIFKYKPFTLL